MSADVREIEPGKAIVVDEGRVIRVTHSGGKVLVNGKATEVDLSDPHDRRRGGGAGGANGRQEVRSAMPGKVVRVLVAVGDVVEPGQGLLILEAMKMQNEVKAKGPGTVMAIGAAEGETIAAGAVLVTVE